MLDLKKPSSGSSDPDQRVPIMPAPGQDLKELLSRVNVDDLHVIVGEDTTATLKALVPPNDLASAMRKAAYDSLNREPEKLFSEKLIRRICYDAMTGDKLTELAARLDLDNHEKIRRLNPPEDNAAWQSYLGFFGIDVHDAISPCFNLDSENIKSDFSLFPHQRLAAECVWNALGSGHGRTVLHMPTGAGKTRTAMHIVCRFLNTSEPTVIVWLAASAELLEQAADAFQEAWSKLGNRNVTLARFWGDHAPDLSDVRDGLIVAGLQKLHTLASRDHLAILRLGGQVKLVIVDEAHQAIAPTYSNLITKLSENGMYNALLGLTATPGRTWSDVNADKILANFFENHKIVLKIDGWDNPVSYLMSEGYLSKPTFKKLEYKPTSELRKTLHVNIGQDGEYNQEMLTALTQSVDRNIVIIDEIKRLIHDGHFRILFFGASVRHAEIVASSLAALDYDAQVVTGTTPISLRQRIIKNFRSSTDTAMVLCNYGVLTTGFDAPNTSAAVIARPTRSLVLYSQMVGRAIRGPKAGGNETCEVSTVLDIELPGFGDVAQAFTNWEDVWHDAD